MSILSDDLYEVIADGLVSDGKPHSLAEGVKEGCLHTAREIFEIVGQDIIEVFLNIPMNEANKETLLKTWAEIKKEYGI